MSDCFDDWNVAKRPTWAGRCREVGAWMAPTVVLALMPSARHAWRLTSRLPLAEKGQWARCV